MTRKEHAIKTFHDFIVATSISGLALIVIDVWLILTEPVNFEKHLPFFLPGVFFLLAIFGVIGKRTIKNQPDTEESVRELH